MAESQQSEILPGLDPETSRLITEEPALMVKLISLRGLERYRRDSVARASGRLTPSQLAEVTKFLEDVKVVRAVAQRLEERLDPESGPAKEWLFLEMGGFLPQFQNQEIDTLEQALPSSRFAQIAYENLVLPPGRERLLVAEMLGGVAARSTVDVETELV